MSYDDMKDASPEVIAREAETRRVMKELEAKLTPGVEAIGRTLDSASLKQISDRLDALEQWRRDLELELGEQDAADLGGAVLEEAERSQAIAERDGLFLELLNWHRMNGGHVALLEILDRHLGPVPNVSRPPAPPEPAIVPGERPFWVRIDASGPVAIVDTRGWDVVHLSPSRVTVSNADAIVAALNQAETPLQELARQVADAAALVYEEIPGPIDQDHRAELWELVRRWIEVSGFKAEEK